MEDQPTNAPTAALQLAGPMAPSLQRLLNPQSFEQMMRMAKAMAMTPLTPDHLRLDTRTGQPLPPDAVQATMFLIVNQSMSWGIDPFTVAQHTYVTRGRLGYEGKLIHALVNRSGKLRAPLSFTFSGPATNRKIVVTGYMKDDPEGVARTVELDVKSAIAGVAKPNAMWTSDPDQKLVYSGCTKWARRHMPEFMLGILEDDEVRVMAAREAEVVERPAPVKTMADIRAALQPDGEGEPCVYPLPEEQAPTSLDLDQDSESESGEEDAEASEDLF